jgi:predicted RNA-binding Zn ribbon-like protein
MRYEDYIANLTRMAVDVVNTGTALGASGEMFEEHRIKPPSEAVLRPLLPLLRDALEAISTGGGLEPVNRLLAKYPPDVHLSAHDGTTHLHHARDASDGLSWLARSCAAGLAHVACGAPDVTVGRCAAVDCGQFFVDLSRNRSRRFCGNTCASRTTVAAYRARQKG